MTAMVVPSCLLLTIRMLAIIPAGSSRIDAAVNYAAVSSFHCEENCSYLLLYALPDHAMNGLQLGDACHRKRKTLAAYFEAA